MRLSRVYVGQTLTAGSILELSPETAAHLAKVLRARAGDEVILFGDGGREYLGVIESVRGARVTASVGAGSEVDRESPLAVTLVQCVPRGDRMDFIVQKATELGVARIVPVLSQRGVVRLSGAQNESKAAHWRAVAVSACEQCGRNRLPVIEAPCALSHYLGSSVSRSMRLVLEPGSDSSAEPSDIAVAVEIAVGPEGGFAPEELDDFRIAGFRRMQLGPRILRTETAAIAALTWLQVRFGDLSSGSARPKI